MLHSRDLTTGEDRIVERLPSSDVWAAPEAPLLASVADAQPPAPGEEDFAVRPELLLVDARTGARRELGPGVAPLWDEAGERLAWLRPVEDRSCAGEICAGAVAVETVEVDSMRSQTVLPAGRWSLLSWAGEALLVADVRAPDRVVVATLEGATAELPVAASEVWGATPDGDWLVRVAAGRVELLPLDGGVASGPARAVAGGGRALAEGSWSPGGDRLAAVELRVGRPARARVVVVSVPDGSLRPVPSSRGATGRVVWSPDGDEVAFARSAGRRGGRLEAVICPVSGTSGCRALFSWVRDVTLLRLEAASGG
jgi:hypothetical protein